MSEHDDFVARESLRQSEPDPADVLLKEADERLRVELVARPEGTPRRWRRPPGVWLTRGDWIRWQINYRFAGMCECGSQWVYRLDTLNLAYGVATADVFLETPPHFVDERGRLR